MPSAARILSGALAACALPGCVAGAASQTHEVAAAAGPAALCAAPGAVADEGRACAAGGLAPSAPQPARAASTAALAGDHVLIQRQVSGSKGSSRHGVAAQAGDLRAAAGCTPADEDPYQSGSLVDCCAGLKPKVSTWDGDGRWYYRCVEGESGPAPAPTPATTTTTTTTTTLVPQAAPAVTAPSVGEAAASHIVQWNVHWSNKDTKGIAGVLKSSSPDIIGLCELTASPTSMAAELTSALGREYKVQPGRAGWQGYGTDIFYDNSKWMAVEGGVQKVWCEGTSGGDRAANWVVLEHRASGKMIVTGGIHTTYCANGCDATHQCELTKLYDKLEAAKSKHPSASVVWMGDLNRGTNTLIVQQLLQGKIGSKSTFAVEDLAETQGNTYFAGGSAIDHILGESGEFTRKDGGRIPGQGITGQHLSGADHFPIFTKVEF